MLKLGADLTIGVEANQTRAASASAYSAKPPTIIWSTEPGFAIHEGSATLWGEPPFIAAPPTLPARIMDPSAVFAYLREGRALARKVTGAQLLT